MLVSKKLLFLPCICMSRSPIANLHQNFAKFEANNDFVKNIRSKISEITANIPDFLSKVDLSNHVKLTRVKSKFLQKLDKKRKKFRLALESLGWGTLADLLDSAFCGEKLNIWV